MKSLAFILLAAVASPAFWGKTIVVEPATIVFTGGRVYTVNQKQPYAETIAVKGVKIFFVGTDAGAKPYMGMDT